MSVQQRVPESLWGPLSFLSLVLGILGAVVGYILTVLGITLYFNLNGIPLSSTDSLIVIATGLVVLVIGYFGGRGFMEFAY